MTEREEVIEAVDRLFVATDAKDWAVVETLFAERVHFDMTSLAGGEPATLTPQQIAAGWREGLKTVPALQHQSGNHLVTIGGSQASVTCYATATHFHPEREKKLTQFYGSYEFHLVRSADNWRIDRFKFEKKFVVEI
jgi:hypothetical protein